MKRICLLPLVALVAVPAAGALDRSQTLALVRIAEQASGIKARTQVRVVTVRPARFRLRRERTLDRAYPRAAQAHDEAVYRALGLTTGGAGVLRKTLLALDVRRSLYDPAARNAYVQAGSGERAAALRAIVHALQDQRYDLRRIAALPGGSDAARAANALVEGHATLVTNVLSRRRAAPRGGPRLMRFLGLQRGFTDTVGLRFAADLRNLGGNRAVLGALARLPATTEQVFHLDKYLERERAVPLVLPVQAGGMSLARTTTFGELDLRALLAVFAVPRLDRVAGGWGGGRTAVYRGGSEAVLVALDWDAEPDAREWADAVVVYVNEAFDAATPGLPTPVSCAAESCWELGGRAIAFEREGRRTSLVVGTDLGPAADLARAAVGAG
jgi:hypothetical protein